ncbi:MAG: helix-turn-helix transcriptional regulator [Adlercreutzia sp.]
MLKAAHPGGLIPPILHPSPLNRENTGERTDRTGALLFAGAVASFGLALVLIGAAVSFAAGAPAPANLDQSTLVFGSLAAACALAALGMMLALRERSLRTQQMRRVTRAEQIQGELDSLGLTPKEMPIAKLILQHQSYATIAAERHLAVRTVQFHATNIFRKAYVSNRRDFERVILADERNDDRSDGGRRDTPCCRSNQTTPPDGRGAARPDAPLRPKYLLARGRLRQPGDGPPRAKPWQRARARRSRPSRWQPHDPPQQGSPAPRQAGGRTAIASAVR